MDLSDNVRFHAQPDDEAWELLKTVGKSLAAPGTDDSAGNDSAGTDSAGTITARVLSQPSQGTWKELLAVVGTSRVTDLVIKNCGLGPEAVTNLAEILERPTCDFLGWIPTCPSSFALPLLA